MYWGVGGAKFPDHVRQHLPRVLEGGANPSARAVFPRPQNPTMEIQLPQPSLGKLLQELRLGPVAVLVFERARHEDDI